MKYTYDRPVIEIKNWLVSQKDIERIINFFKERFIITNVPISLRTESGNNRTYDTYEEMLFDLPKLATDHEIVQRIEISYGVRDNENYHKFKQSWIVIEFGKYAKVNWFLIGGDTDSSFKDWIIATYEEMNRLKNIFEIKDVDLVKKVETRFQSTIVFDPNESIKESIKAELSRENTVEPTPIISILSGSKSNLLSKVTNNQTFAVVIGGLVLIIITYIIFKLFGINLTNLV